MFKKQTWTDLGLHVKCLLLLSSSDQNWNVSMNFIKFSDIKCQQSIPFVFNWFMCTDRWVDEQIVIATVSIASVGGRVIVN
jgi:hypothetical protein